MIGIVDPSVSDEDAKNVIAHEVGHHIVRSNLGSKYIRRIGKYGQEILADQYMSNLTGKPNRYIYPEDNIKVNEDVLSYAETLQELKNPSIDDLSRQVKKFSFDERKRKGWYPRDSNLPDTFDTIVLNKTFDVISDPNGHLNPDDERDKAVITGLVCKKLDKEWKQEWGKRPDGHYIRADVEDALERLEYYN
jgi:hypothetical protein